MMKTINNILSLLLLAAGLVALHGCATAEASRMPVTVSPYYNSDPLTINVGEMSEQLMSEHPTDLVRLANSINANDLTVPTEALYVLAIRLFDLNEKIPAAYWFYNAQFRTRVLNGLKAQDPDLFDNGMGDGASEKLAAYNAFSELAGRYFNEELARNPDGWIEIIDMVQKDMTRLDIRGFVNDFPRIADKIVGEHPEVVQKVSEGLNVLKEVLQENMDEIVRQSRNLR